MARQTNQGADDIMGEEMTESLRRVISDAEELLGATADQAGGKLEALRARINDNIAQARDLVGDADSAMRANARRAASVTDEYVHDNPWSSIGVAAAIGLLVGVLVGRR